MTLSFLKKTTLYKMFHETHSFMHILYFGAVTVEGHGYYSMAAGVLFGLSILALFIKGEEV